jgi:hypothetical protein
MSRTKLVFFGGSKGGVGKSATSHLACLGAILCNQPAAYVLTDPDREIRDKGGLTRCSTADSPSN